MIIIKILKKINVKINSIMFYLGFYLGKRKPIVEDEIIFESERDYWDNSWALYQYLIKNRSNYNYVWLVHNYKRYNDNPNTLFFKFDGWNSGFHLACAKYIFYTHCMHRIKFRKGQICIYLVHGVALKVAKGLINYRPGLVIDNPFQFTITTGPLGVASQAKFILCHQEQILPLGFPRNDILLRNVGVGADNPLIDTKVYNKVILWMPTFRASINKDLSENDCDTETGLPLFRTERDLIELNSKVKENNMIIICKLHHLQADKEVFHHSYSNIKFVTDKELLELGIQLYQMIGKTDALISDYSSICVDYLLLNKPMSFILDDIDLYDKSRGFTFDDIKSVLAGKHLYNKDEMYQWLHDMKVGIDSTRHLRESLMPQMHSYVDDKSCERIAHRFGL